ncbi:Type I transmembrane sorting receptor [Mortierella sp. GBA30]|nr:Type I transmembrane sorting receptor [Mortierella sp. GBA30]
MLALVASIRVNSRADATDIGYRKAKESHQDPTGVVQYHLHQVADAVHFVADNYKYRGHHHHKYQGKRQCPKYHHHKMKPRHHHKKLHHNCKKPCHHHEKLHRHEKKPHYRHNPKAVDSVSIVSTIPATTPTTTAADFASTVAAITTTTATTTVANIASTAAAIIAAISTSATAANILPTIAANTTTTTATNVVSTASAITTATAAANIVSTAAATITITTAANFAPTIAATTAANFISTASATATTITAANFTSMIAAATTTTTAANFASTIAATTTTTTAANFASTIAATTTTTTAANFASTIAATTTTIRAPNFTSTIAATITTTITTTTVANFASTAAANSTFLPCASMSYFPRGGVVSVKLKHIYANAKAQCNHSGTRFARRDTATSPWMDKQNFFVIAVTMGTPPKEYDLVVDTSSVETWSISPTCTSEACKNRKLYDPSESTSSENQYLDYTFRQGEGATGRSVLFTDSLTIAGVTVENQVVGVVTSLSDPFINLLGDGVLALPPFDIKSPSFVDNAFDEGKICEITFAVHLPRSGDGEITIGGVNPAKYRGDLTYIFLSYPLAWQITIDDIAYSGRSLGITLEAAIDTTASSVLLDKRAAFSLYERVPGAKRYTARHWTFPCNSSQDFSIAMNGVSFKVPTDSINLGPVVAGGRDCVSAITSGAEEGHAILGLAFLQNYYTVFDKTTYPHRVGFAPVV